MFRQILVFLLILPAVDAADWPTWRADAGRTAASAQNMPEKLHLLWLRELPALKPAYKETRLQFDVSYEPVVAGKTLIVGSSREDAILAFSTETGAELWRAVADGPVRFAPAIVGDLVIFGADDGVVRCVKLADGKTVWQKRLVPSQRHVLGNQRMISLWPVRGGVVAQSGRVYLAAGVWPLEGTFVFCLDATTGETVWGNDQSSYLYGVHPHDTEARGGLAPQGYLLIDADDLVVPCSTAYPARLDLKTGKLKQFELPSAGRLTGGWFAATLADLKDQKGKSRGLVFDKAVSTKRHEDKPRAEGKEGIQRSLLAAGKTVSFDQNWPELKDKVTSVVLADDKAFAVTENGVLAAYSGTATKPKRWPLKPQLPTNDASRASAVLKQIQASRGYVIFSGGDTTLLSSLVQNSQFHFLVLGGDRELRERFNQAGLYGERVAIVAADVSLPPYFAEAIIALTPGHEQLHATLRPGSGRVLNGEGKVLHTRPSLEGSSNYVADWKQNSDPLVRAPLGVLWFDDALSQFKRSPQPKVVDGVMITSDKDWLDASNRKGKVDYRLLAPKFSDIYTGRMMDEYEASEQRAKYGKVDEITIQQAQYRPPAQKNDWAPDQPKPGMRINPMTGEEEVRAFPKSYGCDGGFDYGGIYTFRSGTAAFYDKNVESGTIHISGPRSGCTNSIVPAGGILNVPYFFEGCTCSYPLPVALALTSLPENFEQWSVWGEVKADSLKGKIQRLGLNFGAPGDRKTRDGTLWLDFPVIGEPSPELEIKTVPEKPETFYRHSLWITAGHGWPWVAASGLLNVENISVSGMKPGDYTVRLTFAAPDNFKRKFRVSLQGKQVLEQVQPAAFIASTESIQTIIGADGNLSLELDKIEGGTLICGLELVRSGLSLSAPAHSEPPRRW
ncbi:MAG: PQQ-like beta-propeller repeat protein [Verrucomicrobiaceae bacterium]|nr:PQQ-like beta-propeller repeat protein [Verrucomicrobiaceae bacterium]